MTEDEMEKSGYTRTMRLRLNYHERNGVIDHDNPLLEQMWLDGYDKPFWREVERCVNAPCGS
jgi:hypothetical protein